MERDDREKSPVIEGERTCGERREEKIGEERGTHRQRGGCCIIAANEMKERWRMLSERGGCCSSLMDRRERVQKKGSEKVSE